MDSKEFKEWIDKLEAPELRDFIIDYNNYIVTQLKNGGLIFPPEDATELI